MASSLWRKRSIYLPAISTHYMLTINLLVYQTRWVVQWMEDEIGVFVYREEQRRHWQCMLRLTHVWGWRLWTHSLYPLVTVVDRAAACSSMSAFGSTSTSTSAPYRHVSSDRRTNPLDSLLPCYHSYSLSVVFDEFFLLSSGDIVSRIAEVQSEVDSFCEEVKSEGKMKRSQSARKERDWQPPPPVSLPAGLSGVSREINEEVTIIEVILDGKDLLCNSVGLLL